MGFCSAFAGFIAVNKAGRHDSVNLLKLIMMDAILAVAIGGNSLNGGKFSITGSIIGAYTIEMLNRTLLRLEIEPAMIKVFKAVFIIILMVVASPVVRASITKVVTRFVARDGGERCNDREGDRDGEKENRMAENAIKGKTRCRTRIFCSSSLPSSLC